MHTLITNEKDKEQYNIEFKSYTEAKEWITNHLDLSKQWSVTDIQDGLYQNGGTKL